MRRKSTISTGPDDSVHDSPPRFTHEMAERGRHVVGDHVLREAKVRGRPRKANGERKEPVSLRLSPEVLAYFRASGEGWQTRIDQVLQAEVARRLRSNQLDEGIGAGVVIPGPWLAKVSNAG